MGGASERCTCVCLYAGIGKIDAGQRLARALRYKASQFAKQVQDPRLLHSTCELLLPSIVVNSTREDPGCRAPSPSRTCPLPVRKPSLSRRVDIQVLVRACTAYTTWTEARVFGVEGRATCSLAAAYRARVWIVLTMFCVHRIRHQFISIYACHGIRVS